MKSISNWATWTSAPPRLAFAGNLGRFSGVSDALRLISPVDAGDNTLFNREKC
jgi:hypothetical protein